MAASLSTSLPWDLANTKWAASLNPILANPLVNGLFLDNVALASGSNTINHKLGRKLQGYLVTLKNANVTIYDTQSTNQTPDLTLKLVASGAATVTIYVF